jgi:tRNA-specific 2-thiouridylase
MKVVLLMSGGIDSAVSAYLLQKQGYDIAAVNMIVWSQHSGEAVKGRKDSCFSPDKAAQMKRVGDLARRMGIEVTFIDCSQEFESEVLGNFRSEYMNGRTPNPCVICNRMVKFGALLDKARSAGIEWDMAATGHYARIDHIGDRFCLRRAVDELKDQSYFLYRLSQQQLSLIIFPLGGMLKTDVRKLDVAQGFHEEGQSESQDFYGGPYSDLLDAAPRPGDIVDLAGKVLGQHQGFWNYTIGQRKGLGIASPRPLYVLALRPESNEVVVGYEESTESASVRASDVNWVSIASADELAHCSGLKAKIRSAGKALPCTASFADGVLTAIFDQGVNAPTPGQSLVIYDEAGYVLCGGMII